MSAHTLLPALLLTVLATPARAQDDRAKGGASVLVGPGYWAEDGPARFRLSIRGESAVATNDTVGFGLVLPLDLASSGDDGFGFGTDRMIIELVPTARMRIAPASVVRGYLDAGLGPWLQARQTTTLFGSDTTQRAGVMTSTGVGLEIGPVDEDSQDIAFTIEPIRARTYFVNGDDRVRADYGGMVGLAVRL